MKYDFVFHSFSLNSFYKIFSKPATTVDSVKYLYEYLKKLKRERRLETITLLEEKVYVEKFYLRDYSRYYAEAFSHFPRFTKRLHFFSCKLTHSRLKELINSDKESLKNFVDENYLGYVIVKPVTDEANSCLIGRSLLKTYPTTINDNIRRYLKSKNEASLFGIDLVIDSIPFQEQDIAVGACASACLWMTQFAIKKWFNIPIRSLAEVTECSRIQTPFASPFPVYPSAGLTLAEIANYIQNLNLHFHRTDKDDIKLTLKNLENEGITGLTEDEIIETLIKAYFDLSFPIICGLQFFDGQEEADMHAVLISGYREDKNGKIVELYIHDDQIGPYCCTELDGSIKIWKNEWLLLNDVSKIELREILIPVDPLVKLRFLDFSVYYYYHIKPQADSFGLKSIPKLYHINEYKRQILTKQISTYIDEKREVIYDKNNPKLRFLSKNMPRYIWVAHHLQNNKEVVDVIFDANRTIVRDPITELYFK